MWARVCCKMLKALSALRKLSHVWCSECVSFCAFMCWRSAVSSISLIFSAWDVLILLHSFVLCDSHHWCWRVWSVWYHNMFFHLSSPLSVVYFWFWPGINSHESPSISMSPDSGSMEYPGQDNIIILSKKASLCENIFLHDKRQWVQGINNDVFRIIGWE